MITEKEIEKLSKEKYPKDYMTSGDEYRREGFIQGYKAALQNKVSDISAEGILDKYYKPKMHWKVVNRKNVLAAMHEYASIVNERKDNIPADFKQVTGHNSPKEMIAYEKGREDEQKVISEWIEQWDGSSNSVMGALLKKKFDEKKDNVGVNDAIEFADWINKNASRNAVGIWGYFGNMFYTKTSKELYDIFKSESQPQPQQKEVDGERLIF
jgi:hypothetical protein